MTPLPIRLDSARRVLLVKPSALGDVVHTLPVVATLKHRYPDLALDWLIEEEAASLVEGHPGISSFLVSGRRRWLRQLRSPTHVPAALREIGMFLRTLRGRRYDVVLDLQGLLKSAAYVVAAGASVRVGLADGREGAPWVLTHRVPVPRPPVHAVERYLALAAAVDAGLAVRDFTIPLGPEHQETATRLLAGLPHPRIVLHASARWETKLWEVERWRAVATALAHDGAGVVLTGGPRDRAMAAAICQGVAPALCSLVGQLSLKEMAAVLRAANLMITVDSGPMHVAAALGTPVVALFGPTDPARTGPLGRGSILRHPLPCSPCLQRRCLIPDTRLCMREITVGDVLDAVRNLFPAKRRGS